MRAALTLLLLGLGAAECERTPPEEFSRTPPMSTPAAAAATTSAPVLKEANAGRCVHPTPAAAPPPVPAGPAPGCPPDPEGGPPPLPVFHVVLADVAGVAVEAEVVRSEHDTMRGLMYRKTLGEERGMLFDLRVRDDHKFWMHNTCIPLDMLYVDEDGLIVGIVENAPTLNDESRGVGCMSRWVLEVNAGWARRHGVKAGQHLVLP
jgi:uncharacterized protein